MKYLDLPLPTPQENLACDEALLNECEEGQEQEILRFWESSRYFVVLGHAGKAASEANLASCRAANIPVLRRSSGGGTVMQGPGCLNFSLLLKIPAWGPLSSITQTHAFVLQRHKEALLPLVGAEITVEANDLALGKKKFSGNAQRRKRRFLLYHGTFLHRFDLSLIPRFLRMPAKQPAYRLNRSHEQFLINLNIPPRAIQEALKQAWNCTGVSDEVPREKISRLAQEVYAADAWNFKF